MCAQRSAVPAWIYFQTTTEGQFSVDIAAWFASWTVPARMLMGTGKGGKDGDKYVPRNGSAIRDHIPPEMKWIRESRAGAVRFVDIDKLDRPATVAQIGPMMGAVLPLARDSTVKAFEDRVLAKARKIDGTKKK